MRYNRWVVATVVPLLAASYGYANRAAMARPAKPAPDPAWEVVAERQLKMTVPRGVPVSRSSASGGESTTVTDGRITVRLRYDPPNPGYAAALLPPLTATRGRQSILKSSSPYLAEGFLQKSVTAATAPAPRPQTTSTTEWSYWISDTVPSGAVYGVTISGPAQDRKSIHLLLRALTLPAPATATDAVRLMRQWSVPGMVSAHFGAHQWLLVGGPPATAQEEFALFSSQDAGQHWTLIDHTTFSPHQIFLNSVGNVGMLFWDAQDGVIVETSPGFVARQVVILRTVDGGQSWRQVPSLMATGATAMNGRPSLSMVHTALTLTVPLHGGRADVWRSTDGGIHWVSVSS